MLRVTSSWQNISTANSDAVSKAACHAKRLDFGSDFGHRPCDRQAMRIGMLLLNHPTRGFLSGIPPADSSPIPELGKSFPVAPARKTWSTREAPRLQCSFQLLFEHLWVLGSFFLRGCPHSLSHRSQGFPQCRPAGANPDEKTPG